MKTIPRQYAYLILLGLIIAVSSQDGKKLYIQVDDTYYNLGFARSNISEKELQDWERTGPFAWKQDNRTIAEERKKTTPPTTEVTETGTAVSESDGSTTVEDAKSTVQQSNETASNVSLVDGGNSTTNEEQSEQTLSLVSELTSEESHSEEPTTEQSSEETTPQESEPTSEEQQSDETTSEAQTEVASSSQSGVNSTALLNIPNADYPLVRMYDDEPEKTAEVASAPAFLKIVNFIFLLYHVA